MKSRYWFAASALAAAGAMLWTMSRRSPRSKPKRYRLELAAATQPPEPGDGSILFIGTATTLIRYGGMTILTDPNFLHRGEQVHIGYGKHSTRLTDPAMRWEELPPIDFVLLSHLHEDHFDKRVESLLARDTPILTTASAARTFKKRGFTRTCALRTWDSVQVRKGETSLRVTSMPGTHGPLLVAALLPEVMGSMLDFDGPSGEHFRIYISGDTLVHEDLTEIPRRFPGIDLALLHLGGTRVLGLLVTMDAAQGIETLRIIGPDLAIPIHYNDYDVFKDPLENFKRAVDRAGLQHKVRYLAHGETHRFSPNLARRTNELTAVIQE
jgi:L-ascorbate metabolism protein UlaG (beta-lactamase superfamily)